MEDFGLSLREPQSMVSYYCISLYSSIKFFDIIEHGGVLSTEKSQ
jgi:hypothetical protein